MKETDNELIKMFLKGDDEAFNQLVRRYQKGAVRIAYSVLNNEQDALDAAQNAFIKVHKNLERFGGRSKFSTWLYRIVYNASMDIGRKKRRYVQHTDDEERRRQFQSPQERSDGEAPEEHLEESETMAIIRRHLEGLPEKYRTVIKLKDVEGLSYNEIAEVLSLSKTKVMSRLYYGREKLRRLIREELKG
ncbi:MAG: sigma-70 family RNA polymerase sigma factor [Planctomycetota bacterium]|nr:sigma-70 family RNA polymerase sigma factor [Planctomycetota bacterium]